MVIFGVTDNTIVRLIQSEDLIVFHHFSNMLCVCVFCCCFFVFFCFFLIKALIRILDTNYETDRIFRK